MDQQPDTDTLVESQIQHQLDAKKSGAPASRRNVTTLDAFFRTLGATLVAARPRVSSETHHEPSGRPRPQEARENVMQALRELRELQLSAQEKKSRYRFLPIVAMLLVTVVVAGVALVPNRQSLSPALLGSWETTAGKYADRTLQISNAEIGFGQGVSAGVRRFPITNVRSRLDPTGTWTYVVTYDNRGVSHQFIFVHDAVPNTITLKNQPEVVWRKPVREQ